jgi:type II secretory pathway pseudopilin PulG
LSPKRARAFTLIEVLISATLLLLMLGSAYEALVLATRYHKKLSDATQIQQETMKVLGRLERSISAASAESLEVAPDSTAIRFVSAQNDQEFFDLDPATGAPRWHRWVGVYLDGTTLIYKEQTIPVTSTVPAFPSIDDIKLDTVARRVDLSKQVRSILFEDGASTISVVLETQSDAKLTNGLTVLARFHVAQ